MNPYLIGICSLFLVVASHAQQVPALDENIPFLVTFGKSADSDWGDDDHSQVFFFSVPHDYHAPVYFRVFDPDCGGEVDEMNQEFNSLTRFTVYGGSECYSHPDAQQTDPKGNFDSGSLLATKTFGGQEKYDQQWYTFGPFNPTSGEYIKKFDAYVFKIICEGVKGDDGNLYRYFMSTQAKENIEVEGGNAFTYEYTFRLHADHRQISHVYPFIDDEVISLEQSNFDWDNDGYIRIVSVVSWNEDVKTSKDNEWAHSAYKVKDEERGKSVDIQFVKTFDTNVNNNNVVFSVRNQYGELLPFFVVPIGGIPQFKGKATSTPIKR
jgi:hypothetical protein